MANEELHYPRVFLGRAMIKGLLALREWIRRQSYLRLFSGAILLVLLVLAGVYFFA